MHNVINATDHPKARSWFLEKAAEAFKKIEDAAQAALKLGPFTTATSDINNAPTGNFLGKRYCT